MHTTNASVIVFCYDLLAFFLSATGDHSIRPDCCVCVCRFRAWIDVHTYLFVD